MATSSAPAASGPFVAVAIAHSRNTGGVRRRLSSLVPRSRSRPRSRSSFPFSSLVPNTQSTPTPSLALLTTASASQPPTLHSLIARFAPRLGRALGVGHGCGGA
eukprot:scaffold53382_cov28-Tisochrysis_lutea.AAC.1